MIKKLANLIGEYKKSAILTSIFVALEVVLEVLIPFIMAKMIDFGLNAGQIGIVAKYGAILAVMALCSLFFGFMSGAMCAKASSGFAKNMRKSIFFHIQDFSFSNIDKISPAGIVTRLTTDANFVQNAFQMIIRMAIRAPLMIALTLAITLSINAKMSLIFLITAPILAVMIFLILSKSHPIFQRVIKEYDQLNNVVEENVQSQRVVKSFVRQKYETKKFDKVSQRTDFSLYTSKTYQVVKFFVGIALKRLIYDYRVFLFSLS